MASPFDDDVDPEIVEEALQDALENPEENFDAFKTLLTTLWEMIKIDTEHSLIAPSLQRLLEFARIFRQHLDKSWNDSQKYEYYQYEGDLVNVDDIVGDIDPDTSDLYFPDKVDICNICDRDLYEKIRMLYQMAMDLGEVRSEIELINDSFYTACTFRGDPDSFARGYKYYMSQLIHSVDDTIATLM